MAGATTVPGDLLPFKLYILLISFERWQISVKNGCAEFVTYPKGKPDYALPPFFQIMILQESDKNWGKFIKIVLITVFPFQSRLPLKNIAYFG